MLTYAFDNDNPVGLDRFSKRCGVLGDEGNGVGKSLECGQDNSLYSQEAIAVGLRFVLVDRPCYECGVSEPGPTGIGKRVAVHRHFPQTAFHVRVSDLSSAAVT